MDVAPPAEPWLARWSAVACFGLALPIVPVLLLSPPAGAERAWLIVIGFASLGCGVLAALLPWGRAWSLIVPPLLVVVAAAGALAAGDPGASTTQVLFVPAFYCAAFVRRRHLIAPAGLYAASAVGLAVSAPAHSRAAVSGDVVVQFVLAALVAVVAVSVERRRHGDRLRVELAGAADAADLSAILARHVLGTDIVAAGLCVADDERPTLAEMVVEVGQGARSYDFAFRIDPTDALARAAYVGPIAIMPDAGSREREARFVARRGYGAGAVLPLRVRGQLVGFMLLARNRPAAFSARRLRALERMYAPLADGVAAYLLRRERDDRARLALEARETSRQIAAARDLATLWSALLDGLRRMLRPDRLWVVARDPDRPTVLSAVASFGERAGEYRIDTSREVSIAQTAMADGQPLWVADVASWPAANRRLREAYALEALLFLPLDDADGTRGLIVAHFDWPRLMRPVEIDGAGSLVSEAAMAWGRIEAEDRLRLEATRDALTALLNRAGFQQGVTRAFAAHADDQRPLSLVLCDLDHLKHINDTHGHSAGDGALRAVADVLRSCARQGDIVGRLGGDEFGWLLPDSAPDSALAAAERVVRTVAAVRLDSVGAISLSAGVASAAAGSNVPLLFERADAALYDAKSRGRGIVIAGDGPRGLRRPPTVLSARTLPPPVEGATIDDVGLAAAREWVTAFRVPACAVTLIDGGVRRRIAWYEEPGGEGIPDEGESRLADFPAIEVAVALRSTCQVVVDEDAHSAEAELVREWGFASMLFVPTTDDDEVVGGVELYDTRRRSYTADEQRLALVLARHTAHDLRRLRTR